MKTSSSAGYSSKPAWLRIRLRTTPEFQEVRRSMRELSLNTVCEEARCPNIYECWSERTATFMILGDICTRRCGFCAVTSGRPNPGVDADEPRHLAEAVAKLGIRHAVITAVDRDDLPDGGAGHFAAVINALRERVPTCAVEILTPDFKGVDDPLTPILAARPDIFSHNVETVPRLYRTARPGSSYAASLALLAEAVRRGAPRVKTGVMVGLGESRAELAATLRDIRATGTEVLTIGQYLQPTTGHLPVARYVPPAEFEEIRAEGLALGFDHVEAGPLVRSSYHARDHYGPGGPPAGRPDARAAGGSRLAEVTEVGQAAEAVPFSVIPASPDQRFDLSPPWTPAFAGVTEIGGAVPVDSIVIPAKAGIQSGDCIERRPGPRPGRQT